MKLRLWAFVSVISMLGLLPGAAGASEWWHLSPDCSPDSVGSGSVTVSDSVSGSFWSFQVNYEVYSADNCANPKPVKGSFTYVYTVTFSDEGPVPGLSLEDLRVLIASSSYVVSAGYITGGPGVAPASVDVVSSGANSVTATFNSGDMTLGATSLPIYIVSPYQPGAGVVNLQVTLFSGQGAALVPSELPQACPCATSYWQLRTLNWLFFLGDFPGTQFGDVKTKAVALSGGYFTSTSDLVNALLYTGLLDVRRSARRELAAVLMNTAAGELFPANTRCRLFLGTNLDEDSDGVADATVASEIGEIISEIQSGDLFQQLDAIADASAINNGQDVMGMVLFH